MASKLSATPFLRIFPMLKIFSKQCQCASYWQWPCLILLRQIIYRCPFLHLSPPDNPRCDVLGFVPAGIVSQVPERSRSYEMQKPSVAMVALSSSLTAQSSPLTPACPGQQTHTSQATVLDSVEVEQQEQHINKCVPLQERLTNNNHMWNNQTNNYTLGLTRLLWINTNSMLWIYANGLLWTQANGLLWIRANRLL